VNDAAINISVQLQQRYLHSHVYSKYFNVTLSTQDFFLPKMPVVREKTWREILMK
jgi:hypothetical protein